MAVQLLTVKNWILSVDPNNEWLKSEANGNDVTKIGILYAQNT